jgi:hypothetical protein
VRDGVDRDCAWAQFLRQVARQHLDRPFHGPVTKTRMVVLPVCFFSTVRSANIVPGPARFLNCWVLRA